MRVAYLVSMKRGLPVFTYREVKLLRQRAVDVHLYVMRDGQGVAMPEADWPVVRISVVRLPWHHISLLFESARVYLSSLVEAVREKTLVHFFLAGHFVSQIRRSGIDVIYCFEGKHALWIAYFIARWVTLPIVVMVHAEMVTTRTHFEITKRAARQCATIMTGSEHIKRKLIERFDLPEQKIKVVRLWSPYQRDERIKVLIVGEWSERKGHETVLDAFKKLSPERYVLWVVGGGTWSGEFYDVAAEVERRKLEDRVVLWGRIPEEMLKILYESCDIFALPSRTTTSGITEGTPVALMEAMSYGRPVVSTFHAGIPELVEQILVPENDAEQLREAFETLGQDPELRRRLGERNRDIIRQRYSSRNVDVIQAVLTNSMLGAEYSD